MRINGPTASAPLSSTAASRRTASGTFSLGEPESARSSAPASAPRTVAGIDALLALQGADDPTERRRRAVRRGSEALDLLDELKLALLADGPQPTTLHRLKDATAGFAEGSGDPGLDAVLAEIELRLAVEIAKMGVR